MLRPDVIVPDTLAEAVEALQVRGAVALARGAYAQAWQWLGEGAVLLTAGKLDEVGYALALLGIAACRLGHPSEARQYVQEAMGMAAETGSFPIVLFALPAISVLLADEGQGEHAVELYALAALLVGHGEKLQAHAGDGI